MLSIKTINLNNIITDKNIPTTLKGKKIVYVSDFQFDLPFGLFNHKAMKKVVREINSINPDLVVLGGDYPDAYNNKSDAIYNYLKMITGVKIAVLGNHDYKYKRRDHNVEFLESFATVLINKSFEYEGIFFYGLDDYKGSPNLKPTLDKNKVNLVISHRPDAFIDMETDFDLMLSGHTHGGMITLFGKYAPLSHNGYGQKLVSGFVQEGNRKIYVSRGVGGNVFGIPMRFFSKPEIVLIEY